MPQSFIRVVCTCFFICFAIGANAAQQLMKTGEMRIQYDNADKPLLHASGGGLLALDANNSASPVVRVFDGTGLLSNTRILRIPNATRILVSGYSLTPGGTLGVCGAAYTDDGKGAGFLLFVQRDGSTLVVQTYPFAPMRIAMARDETAWVEGFEVVRGFEKDALVNKNANVLRHFDATGKIVESQIPRSTISDPLSLIAGRLQILPGGVGWYAGPDGY